MQGKPVVLQPSSRVCFCFCFVGRECFALFCFCTTPLSVQGLFLALPTLRNDSWQCSSDHIDHIGCWGIQSGLAMLKASALYAILSLEPQKFFFYEVFYFLPFIIILWWSGVAHSCHWCLHRFQLQATLAMFTNTCFIAAEIRSDPGSHRHQSCQGCVQCMWGTYPQLKAAATGPSTTGWVIPIQSQEALSDPP